MCDMTEELTIVHRTAIFMENVCNRIYCCNIAVNIQQRLCDIGGYYYRTLACFCHPGLSNNAHDDKDQSFKVIYSDLAVMFPLYHVKHQVCDQKNKVASHAWLIKIRTAVFVMTFLKF
ncbi:unnamed protein product [Fusarium graminearum]|nr:unnamed protein product [Fusarium graminearum]